MIYNLILNWDSFVNNGEKQLSVNLIIGTGKRARETIIPALEILNDKVFLYSRNLNSNNPLLTKNYIKQLTTIDSNLKKFDRIFIAIPQTWNIQLHL